MDNRIVLDKHSFMALASESRVRVLKKLDERRMTVTELSKRLEMSKPAVLKHLDKLVTAGLIKKIENKRKWVYYSLTLRGKNILHPERVKITLLLSTSLISLFGAIAMFLQSSKESIHRSMVQGNFSDSTVNRASEGLMEKANTAPLITTDPSFFYIGIFLVGVTVILVIIAFYIWRNRYKKNLFINTW